MIISADFHLHSCLSPCGDLAMSPTAIVELLVKKNVQLAALTDHNSALNCPAFAVLCKKNGIAALYGIEAQTMEEVHVLCLFAQLEEALCFGKDVASLMPLIPNNPEKMGDQIYVDENENILGEVENYLVVSADIGIDDMARRVHDLGGLVVPAHVDRAAFSLSSQLGSITEGCWDALEVVRLPLFPDGHAVSSEKVSAVNPALSDIALNYPLITSSDAHFTEHIGRRAFVLDMGDVPLLNADGSVNVQTLKAALKKRTACSQNCCKGYY